MDWLMRCKRAEPAQDPDREKARITRPASGSHRAAMTDEGIVQAISKGMEQLSRRLHQWRGLSGEIRRVRNIARA